MSRTVYVNGSYLPEEDAKVSIFDRGFLMADAVYEVVSVLDGKLIDFDGHIARLWRSLDELGMKAPGDQEVLLEVHRQLIARNDLSSGLIYMQVSRGTADRDFTFDPQMEPTLVLFTQAKPNLELSPAAAKGIKIVSLPDLRWGRRDIKTTQLLYPSLAKMKAAELGADDAWLVEDGFVTEGPSSNAYIVSGGKIITRQLGHEILSGITRAAVLRLAREAQIEVEERSFTIEEAQRSDEAFITSASTFVAPVVAIDGMQIGDGTPGTMARRLREIYLEECRKSAG